MVTRTMFHHEGKEVLKHELILRSLFYLAEKHMNMDDVANS